MEAKRSIFDHLKDFVFEEESNKASPVPAPIAHTNGTPDPAVLAKVEKHLQPTPTATPDPAVLAKLEARLQSALPPAYAAFMEKYDLLREDIPSEATRFKIALKTSGTTAAQVITALEQLLDTMSNARADFVKSFEENQAKRLGEAEKSIKATEDLITSHEAQLKSIQETIVSLRTKRAADAEGMATEHQRLEGIHSGFEAAHAQIVDRLNTQKNHILNMPKA